MVSYTSVWTAPVYGCYVTAREVAVMAVGEEWGSASLVFENSILLLRVQGYRGLTEKMKTVKTVHNLRYSVLKISEYFRGVVFCESFGIYGTANLGIWCSVVILS